MVRRDSSQDTVRPALGSNGTLPGHGDSDSRPPYLCHSRPIYTQEGSGRSRESLESGENGQCRIAPTPTPRLQTPTGLGLRSSRESRVEVSGPHCGA